MAFKDADEVRHYIGGVFTRAFGDTELSDRLKSTGAVLKFDFTDPDAVLVVDMVGQSVGDGTDQPTPTAVMRMTSETGSAYWQGKVNLPLAMARGKIKVEGSVAGLLKLAPLGKKLFPSYVAALEADDRQDLIA
jgi:putative sterol carrier protein